MQRSWNAEAERGSETLPKDFTAAQSLSPKGPLHSENHIYAMDQLAASVLSRVANRMFDQVAEANDTEAA